MVDRKFPLGRHTHNTNVSDAFGERRTAAEQKPN